MCLWYGQLPYHVYQSRVCSPGPVQAGEDGDGGWYCLLVSVTMELVPDHKHFIFYKGELVSEMVPRLLHVIRSKYEDRFGGRIVRFLVTPVVCCLYLHLLLPVTIRRRVLHRLVQLRSMYRKQFVEYSRNSATSKLPNYQQSVLKMFQKLNFSKNEKKVTIKFSDENTENITNYIFH